MGMENTRHVTGSLLVNAEKLTRFGSRNANAFQLYHACCIDYCLISLKDFCRNDGDVTKE